MLLSVHNPLRVGDLPLLLSAPDIFSYKSCDHHVTVHSYRDSVMMRSPLLKQPSATSWVESPTFTENQST